MIDINSEELRFIDTLGLLFEESGGSKTLGRVFGYLLLADRPKNLDEIAADLLFSKATASLTVRQGLLTHFFEKVSISGQRKDFYRVNTQTWINAMNRKIESMARWEKLIGQGLALTPPENRAARENLVFLKDYFEFIRWYFSDLNEQYERWKKGEIKKTDKREKDASL